MSKSTHWVIRELADKWEAIGHGDGVTAENASGIWMVVDDLLETSNALRREVSEELRKVSEELGEE